MTAIKSDVGGSQPSGSTPNIPGAVPKSDVRQGLEWLAGQITALSASLTALVSVAQYTADAAFALGQVARGEARQARLAARAARDQAEMARQRAGIAQGEAQQARKKAIAATTAAAVAQDTADIGRQEAMLARGGLQRVRLRVADTRLVAEDAKVRATQALSAARDARRRTSSDQIALSAQVFN